MVSGRTTRGSPLGRDCRSRPPVLCGPPVGSGCRSRLSLRSGEADRLGPSSLPCRGRSRSRLSPRSRDLDRFSRSRDLQGPSRWGLVYGIATPEDSFRLFHLRFIEGGLASASLGPGFVFLLSTSCQSSCRSMLASSSTVDRLSGGWVCCSMTIGLDVALFALTVEPLLKPSSSDANSLSSLPGLWSWVRARGRSCGLFVASSADV